MARFDLPPYGIFSGRYRTLAQDVDKMMLDWQPNQPQQVRLTAFRQWRKKQLDKISELLWPTFDINTKTWSGAATGTAVAMSEAEIDLMVSEFRSGRTELSKKPLTKLMRPDMEDHNAHFVIEDDVDEPAGINFAQYDESLNEFEFDNVLSVIDNALVGGTKTGGFFWFKTRLVRPRPYQVAMMFGRDDFSCEIAKTALHSSITSGHCIQGMMLGCAVYEDWLKTGARIPSYRLEALGQYMVDWGDRRVFAGVHYPTDNIASWSLAVNIIPELFSHQHEIMMFVMESITKRSRVFEIVNEKYRNDKTGRLETAVQFLDTMVLKKGATIEKTRKAGKPSKVTKVSNSKKKK